ncbi:MAG: hypothetical protein L6R41_005711 [Letrouitia leprolyta]|nr:MAG: hypothetical protein L6R41_005711 [Letrouitia leprolyta]
MTLPRVRASFWFLAALSIPLVTALNASITVNTGYFDRDQCYTRTLKDLAEGVLAADDEVFFRDKTGRPMTSPETLTLTLTGCKMLCGPKRSWYSDIGPRLSLWLIPSLLLISNMELSPLDKRRFFAILHLLGDPIDSFGSLIDKLASWDHCYRIVERRGHCERCTRTIATVFAGLEEVEGRRLLTSSRRPQSDPEGQKSLQRGKSQPYLDMLANRHDPRLDFQRWRRTALELANSRSDELLRTGLAIAIYIFTLIGGFVRKVGGDPSSPPGGRIATGVLVSWLIPIVLLSNLIGNFPSPYTARDILARFLSATDCSLNKQDSEIILLQESSGLKEVSSSDSSAEAHAWNGGIYSFRPWRHCPSRPRNGWPRITLTQLLSILPVLVSITGASIILWNLIPNGFNCRHIWSIAVFFAWLLSAFLTWISYTPRFLIGKNHWYFVIVKDTLVAVPSIIMMFLSACGLFNSCQCWSGHLYYGKMAHVALEVQSFFEHNDSTIYQYVVWSCFALQGGIFVFVAIKWRRGVRVLRWSDKARREERERMMTNSVCECMAGKDNNAGAVNAEAAVSEVQHIPIGKVVEV